ncbi:ABC transporter permease [Gluconobacter wancherniae]|uniref:Peptide ABC transporter permease n=1 Tax=Gluconobacter wancherniae NBRC 103581 TaxID=656744 RepID=A0A511AVP8_9PROT|nr:ABC transporter permease [Gluconobacter wancherniae]MBF0852486.1 ABC transporter permease [Gluconobacter wancherniae]GBD56804.1 peptide ABC transporter permease [Gluconobacter wancherniae NBRC 103581]GBR64577.1 oligopeptide transporter permease OppB [Gluconobacter wancherniae NBRC 103581]GEK92288.1 peptide ABC transporter permease [Gluconobacter wancherniae NBRC 103581]
MIGAFLSRAGQMLLVIFGISVLVFSIFFATPGADPTARIAGRGASPQVVARIRAEYGFDRALPIQYVRMMEKLFVTRDLTSYVDHGEPVVPEVMGAAPVTLSLVLWAAFFWVGGSLLIGVASAVLRDSWIDRILMVLGVIGLSMPVFWLGEVVNLFTQSRWHDTWMFSWVPSLGYVPFSQNPWGWAKALFLPSLTLASSFIGLYARVLRAELLGAMGEDSIRTARAKGAGPVRVWLWHGLRLSWLSYVSLFGLDFAQLLGGGALLTEVVFALPGVGRLTYQGLATLDLPLIMATVMYSAIFVVVANALIDGIYTLLDPRIAGGRNAR